MDSTSSLIIDSKIRTLSISDFDVLKTRPDYSEYFSLNEPWSLPRLIEEDYVHPEYPVFYNNVLESNGFDAKDVDLRYNVLDIKINTHSGNYFWIPFMIFSSFNFQRTTVYGPFIAGHQAGISMVQSPDEPKYTRFYIKPKHSRLFNSSLQTELISNSINCLLNGTAEVVIPALPDRARDPNEYNKSGIARVLMGGHITDPLTKPYPISYSNNNPLRGNPFSICPGSVNTTFQDYYSTDFTFHKLTNNVKTNSFLTNKNFLSLLVIIRLMGPYFKNQKPQFTNGLLFNPKANIEFVEHFLEKFFYA